MSSSYRPLSALLAQYRLWSRVGDLLILAALFSPLWMGLHALGCLLITLMIVFWLWGKYCATRVAIDAAMFTQLDGQSAEQAIFLFDQQLTQSFGKAPSLKRDMPSRVQGAMRWFRRLLWTQILIAALLLLHYGVRFM
ncbi:hypothetical protein [Vibrio stylophorae]|nr:hypothetical protein [Vibrio stylophorae]